MAWKAVHQASVSEKYEATGFLDVDERHPALFGEAILLRDDDGMGFDLGLAAFIGKEVKITIEVLPEQRKRYWGPQAQPPEGGA